MITISNSILRKDRGKRNREMMQKQGKSGPIGSGCKAKQETQRIRTLLDTGESAQCHLAAWVGGGFGGEWKRVCVAESLCCPPETPATKPQYKIQSLKKEKKRNKTDYQQAPIIQHRELCLVFCGSLGRRGVWGRMDTCVCG